jgi:multidrug resistance efflux pump
MTKQRRLAIVGTVVLVLLVGLLVWKHFRPHQLILVGIVDANEVVVTPRVQARLDSLWIDEGSTVKAGQRIAALDQRELAAQTASTVASEAGARAEVAQAEASAQQSAADVAGGRAGAEARMASAQADLARLDAQLQLTRTSVNRFTALEKSGAIAPSTLDSAVAQLHMQEAAVAAAHQQVLAAQGDLQRANAGTLSAEAARRAVLAEQARLSSAQADVNAARTRLGYSELLAPVSGVVQVLTARQGELVGPGSPVAVIVDPDNLWVRVSAPETDAGAVAVGDSLTVQFASGRTVRGRVISKGAEGDFATQHDISASKRDIRAVAFRVAIPNADRTIIPGMTANVLLPTGTEHVDHVASH